MDSIIRNELDKMYNLVIQKVNKIVEIFNDFYGEEKVDLQDVVSIDTFIDIISGISMERLRTDFILSTEGSTVFSKYKKAQLGNINPSDAELLFTELSNNLNIRYIQYLLINFVHRPFIIVHFPSVLVTNEYNQCTEVKNLYVKIDLNYNGTMYQKFSFNRAEYQYSHFVNNYMHSHIHSIPIDNFENFVEPCLGTGPIGETCYDLRNLPSDYDDTYFEDIWRMFCLELSKYVEVESLIGIPYHKLSTLGITGRLLDTNNTFNYTILPFNRSEHFYTQYKDMIKDFIKDFIPKRKLKFNYINGGYSIGMTYFGYVMTISNNFIEWYNEQYNNRKYTFSLEEFCLDNLLQKCVIYNNNFYTEKVEKMDIDVSQYNGKKVCKFKGKDISVVIHEKEGQEVLPSYYIFTPMYSLGILTNILYIINYEYSKSTFIPEEGIEPCKKIRIF